MVTLHDVAKAAGVSKATASRSLANSDLVAPATRDRVRQVAAELDFVPTPSATRLATGRTSTVAVVTPFLTKWYFAHVINAAEQELRRAGYDVLLVVLQDDQVRGEFFDTMPLRRRCDAVVLLTMALEATEFSAITDLGLPVVAIGELPPDVHGIGIDDRAAAAALTQHLLDLGHRSIAYIGGPEDGLFHFSTPGVRRAGVRDALTAAGLTLPPAWEETAEFTPASGREAMERILAAGPAPTAVLAAGDEIAVGALLAARDAGLRVPDDLSIAGIDDHEMAELFGLTTMRQDPAEQGRLAARILLDRLAREPIEGSERTHTVLPTELVVRHSTRAP